MIKLPFALLTGTAVLALAASSLMAQDAPTVRVDVKEVKFSTQFTPQFQGSNIIDKRWRPKSWLEVDVAFDAKKARVAGDKSVFIEGLEIKYYVALNKADSEGKTIVLTASVNYLNIPVKETAHALVFASPAALSRILEKDFSNSDVKAVGVEVNFNGLLVGGHTTGGGKFWETSAAQLSMVDGVLLPKAKTPFAPLWGDYDVDAKQ